MVITTSSASWLAYSSSKSSCGTEAVSVSVSSTLSLGSTDGSGLVSGSAALLAPQPV